jgi:hypothetical protein
LKSLRAGFLYFLVTFAAGFVLGTIRVLTLVPRIGDRNAELLEAPLMLAVTFVAARWIVRRETSAPGQWNPAVAGLCALAMLLLVEFTVVLALRGLTVQQYFASRDPVSGSVYLVMLLVFAGMPALLSRRRTARS